MKVIQYSLRTLAVIFVSACSNDGPLAPTLEDTLRANFESIYLAAHGLDFPSSKAKLDRCRATENQSCLKTFNSVKSASGSIRELRSIRSLRETLSIIESSCVSENEKTANFVCYGGIISLYFYNDPEEDKIIFEAVKNYPTKIKNIFFNNSFAWQENRPDNSPWVEFISTATVDWVTPDAKTASIEWFTKEESWHYWMDVIQE